LVSYKTARTTEREREREKERDDGKWNNEIMDNFRRLLHSFLLPAPKCTDCIKQVLMLELGKTDTLTGFSTGPQLRM
jgi:hypothetical protein